MRERVTSEIEPVRAELNQKLEKAATASREKQSVEVQKKLDFETSRYEEKLKKLDTRLGKFELALSAAQAGVGEVRREVGKTDSKFQQHSKVMGSLM